GRALRPPDPAAAPAGGGAPPALAGELLLRDPPPVGGGGRHLLHDGDLPGRRPHGLAPDGAGRWRPAARRAGPRARRRPAHALRRGGPGGDRPPDGGGAPLRGPRRLRDRGGPDLAGSHPALRAPSGHDARRRRAHLGPEPHLPVRHLPRHLHRRRAGPRGGRLGRPAGPLVGHPRPRPLPAVDLVADPARRRVPRRVALGAGQRRSRVHRRVLGGGRRQRPRAARRLPLRRPLGGPRRRRRRLRRARRGRRRARGLLRDAPRGRPPHRRGGHRHLRPAVRAVPPGRPQPDEGPHRRRARGHRDLRGDRRPSPPLLPHHHRRGGPAVVTERPSTIAETADQLTPEWLTAALRSSGVLASGEVTAVDAKPLGTGQMCDSARLTLTYSGGEGPETMVAKLPASDETSRTTAINLGSYVKEVRFYTDLADGLSVRT